MKFHLDGLHFRKFTPHGRGPKGLLYNTWAQRVALFEDDSAEVLDRLFGNSGTSTAAIAYMVENGEFTSHDPHRQAQDVLDRFLESLREASLLMTREEAKAISYHDMEEERVRRAVDPTLNPELQISGMMADSHILYALTLELTYRCNERCIHCYCPEDRNLPEMTTSVILELLRQFRSLGGFRLQLTGGELLLRKDIIAILEACREHGFLVDLITNLTLLTPGVLLELVKLAPREVGCSVYSADAQSHDRITGVPGSFNKTIESIRLLRQEGIPVLIKSPLMDDTLPGWPALKALAAEMGCGWQCDLSITPKNDGGQCPTDLRAKDLAEIEKLFKSALYHIAAKDEPLADPRSPSPDAALCGAGASALAVSPDGAIRPCIGLMDTLGTFPTDSLADVWEHSPWFANWNTRRLVDIDSCRACDKIQFCSRCPGAWALETGSVEKPAPYTCLLAETWKRAQAGLRQP